MEKNGSIVDQQPSSFSWLLDNSNRPSKSLWLQTTLAELERKIKKILAVVEDDGDTFAERAEMYYQKRPQLIKLIEDVHKSYRALADKYDLIMLGSESLGASNRRCSTSNSFRQVLLHHSSNNFNSGHTNTIEPRDSAPELDHYDQHHCDKEKEKVKENVVASDHKHGFDELLVEVSKLIEENTSKQAELIRRYNMKREDMKQLVEENGRLRDLLAQRKIDHVNYKHASQTNTNSKWKAINLLGKLLR